MIDEVVSAEMQPGDRQTGQETSENTSEPGAHSQTSTSRGSHGHPIVQGCTDGEEPVVRHHCQEAALSGSQGNEVVQLHHASCEGDALPLC